MNNQDLKFAELGDTCVGYACVFIFCFMVGINIFG